MVCKWNKNDLQDERAKTSLDSYIFCRQKELILELVKPASGERMLEVGGRHWQIFREKRCSVTGLVSSVKTMESIRKQFGKSADLYAGDVEDMPFSDDEFDIVAVINTLETASDPQKVIAEAIRVCRGRVFLGFINKYSLAGTNQRLKEIFGFSSIDKINFFSIEEMKEMIGNLIGRESLKWGSVIYFPTIVYGVFSELEELVPHMRNPLGAFAGFTFPAKYIYRTAQSPITPTYKLKDDNQVTAPEAVRGMLREVDR